MQTEPMPAIDDDDDEMCTVISENEEKFVIAEGGKVFMGANKSDRLVENFMYETGGPKACHHNPMPKREQSPQIMDIENDISDRRDVKKHVQLMEKGRYVKHEREVYEKEK